MARTERLPSSLWLVGSETRMQLRLLRRNPVSVLFTVLLPLLLLPLLDALNGGLTIRLAAAPRSVGFGPEAADGPAPWMQYATPAIAGFAVVAACFANLAIRTAVAREAGVLKRVRGTPLSPSAHLAGRVLSNAIVALLVAGATIGAGVALYDVQVKPNDLGVVVALVLLAAAAFSALGLAVTIVIPNGDAAPAVVYAVLFPLAFVSNVFYPPDLAPAWMARISDATPLGALVSAMVGAVTPGAEGTGVLFGEVAAIVGWGVFGAVVSVLAFRWVPSRERTTVGSGRSLTPASIGAVIVGVAALAAAVVVPKDRPLPPFVVGTVDQLAADGIVSTPIIVAPGDVTFAGLDERAGTAFGFGSTTGDLIVTANVIDTGDVPTAIGTFGCSLALVDDGDPEWLERLAPGSSLTARLFNPCSGEVLAADGSCLSASCIGFIRLPVEIRDGDITVRPEGTLIRTAGSGELAPSQEPIEYRGTVRVGADDDAETTERTFTMTNSDGAVTLDGGDLLVVFLTNDQLGSVFDVQVTTARGEPITSLMQDPYPLEPVGFASLRVDDESTVVSGDTSYTGSRPTTDTRLLTRSPVDDTDLEAPRGLLRLSTTGALLEWTTIDLDLLVDDSEFYRILLTRVPNA